MGGVPWPDSHVQTRQTSMQMVVQRCGLTSDHSSCSPITTGKVATMDSNVTSCNGDSCTCARAASASYTSRLSSSSLRYCISLFDVVNHGCPNDAIIVPVWVIFSCCQREKERKEEEKGRKSTCSRFFFSLLSRRRSSFLEDQILSMTFS